MQSMTGYGRGEAASAGCRVVVECASVNRKQLDVAALLPREYAVLEPRIRETVAKSIQRGRIQASIKIQSDQTVAGSLLDAVAARQFHDELKALQRELGLKGEITLDHLLRGPAVVREAAVSLETETLWPVVEKALAQALKALIQMRREEGAHLRADLEKRGTNLGKLAGAIAKRAPLVPKMHRVHLLKRLKEARLKTEVSESRIVEEIAIFAERCDVSEEATRIQSHLQQFAQKLAAGTGQGRELEFLVQELGREFNTTGAKASDAAITKLVVEAKAELEKMREQLANVE